MLSVIKLQTSYQTTKFFTENVLAIDIKKNNDIYEQASLLRCINIRIKQNSNAWALV